MRRLLTIPFILMMLTALVVSPVARAQDVEECTCEESEVVWGIQRGPDVPFIYSIDIATNTATFVADTEKNANLVDFPNGVGYDDANERLYYAELGPDGSRLHYYDFAGNQILAGGLTGTVAGAEVHDGVYYYIPQGTGDLWAATLLPDGTIDSNDLVKSDVSDVGSRFGFGDMVITADGSTMFISAAVRGVPQFFSIDLSGNNYNVIDPGIDPRSILMQLAFGVGGTLYGHSAGTGMFYNVDTTTGTRTEIGTVTGSETGLFTDLASFQTQTCDCVEVQCPISTLDFEGQDAGTVIDDEYAPAVTVSTDDPVNHPAMIFDSASPTGGDIDLGTPNADFGGPGIGSGGALGAPGENSEAHDKVLIISEDGSSSDPNDDNSGGTITLTFDAPRPVYAVEILDIDAGESGSVTANLDDGSQVVSNFDALGNNSYQQVVLDAQGVTSLDVTFSSSGALASVIFCPPECVDTEVVWGIQRGVDVPFIYSIDIATNTATFVADTEKNANVVDYPNGVGYDDANDRLYYAELGPDGSRLHYYDFAGNQILAGGLTGTVAGAEVHDGVYYYIPQGTGDLWAATLLPDGTIDSNDLVKSDVSGAGDTYGFGDMVVAPDGSKMFVSARAGGVTQFFGIDLSGNNYDLIASNSILMQLAFGVGGVLYGHSAGTGMFYSVDTATGAVTEIGNVTGSETGVFTDLASFLSCTFPV